MKGVLIGLATMWLTCCQYASPERSTPAESPVSLWLQVVDEQMQLTPEEAKSLLRESPPAQSDLALLRQLLLQQQRQELNGWIEARDGLREMLDRNEQRDVEGLLKLLLVHNQSMINASLRESELGRQLQDSQAQGDLLEAKIRTLTNLEKRLNIRKETGTIDSEESATQ